jgi:hypothetical protein
MKSQVAARYQVRYGKLATVPEARDAVFWEQAKIWNRMVLEFMSQH